MSGCSHDCANCKEKCSEEKKSMMFEPNKDTKIKKIIAVMSGKGGVGKSLVTSMLAVTMQRKGYKTAILDSDIIGPSIPKAFGVDDHVKGDGNTIFPAKTKTEIKMMSMNLLLPSNTDPVLWRGPMVAGVVGQFYKDVAWGDVDFMFVDMPPGTGDVSLTVFQSLPIDGLIVVTSPQELVSMIVEKSVKMAHAMNIPVVGLVENMSYFECPDCKKTYEIFGRSNIADLAYRFDIKNFAKLPINPQIANLCDEGEIENFKGDWLDEMTTKLEELL